MAYLVKKFSQIRDYEDWMFANGRKIEHADTVAEAQVDAGRLYLPVLKRVDAEIARLQFGPDVTIGEEHAREPITLEFQAHFSESSYAARKMAM